MTQDDAGSAPMLGSQRGTPIAWAVMVRWEYRDICDTYEQAKERADAITYWDDDDLVTASVQPLYRSPTLTECERVAMRFFLEKHRKIQREGENYCCLEASPHADAIQGLLERLA